MKPFSKIHPTGPEAGDDMLLVTFDNERAVIDLQLWLAKDINSGALP